MGVRLKFLLVKAIGKWKASKMSCQFPLLDLPNELIALVIEHVESQVVLRSLACACHRLQALTEPVLYRQLLIRIRPTAEHVLASFRARTERAAALQVLNVPSKQRVGPDFSAVGALFGRARNLREISFESPECSSNNFENEDDWQEMTDYIFKPFALALQGLPADRPLQKLTKLTLHMNGGGSPYWSLDARSLPILQQPTLRELHLSCVNVNRTHPLADDVRFSTPLKRLYIEECNLTPAGLKSVLSLPKALESLHIGENCHNIRNFEANVDASCNHLFERSSSATLAALSQQQHSLVSLSYATTPNYYQNRQLHFAAHRTSPVHGGFANFLKLEHVTLNGFCENFERAVMSSTPPPKLCRLDFKGQITAPSGSRRDCVLSAPFLRVPASTIPADLKELNFTIDTVASYHDVALPPFIRQSFKKQHADCAKEGIVMKVFYKPYNRLIPPYLYGETEAVEELIYAGGQDFLGRFAQADDDSDGGSSDENSDSSDDASSYEDAEDDAEDDVSEEELTSDGASPGPT